MVTVDPGRIRAICHSSGARAWELFLCRRAREAGAEIVRDFNDTDYGSREFSAREPEGHLWHFGTYAPG